MGEYCIVSERWPALTYTFWIRNVDWEEGQEPDLPEINLLCQESFDEGKPILPLMHSLPILSTTT